MDQSMDFPADEHGWERTGWAEHDCIGSVVQACRLDNHKPLRRPEP
jgi:hypothetical protein